jgi:GMP synthase (glutamine-hydrolysing)
MARDSLDHADKKPVIIVLHQENSHPGRVGQWFVNNGHKLDIRRPRFGDPLPSTLEHHCGAVIFGGPMSATDPDDYIKTETDWIGVALKEQKPFFGICLGAQMLARHLGAEVGLHSDGQVEVGYCDVSPTTAAAPLGPWPQQFYQWHKEGFALPSGATPLARSNGPFPNQAFQVGPTAFGVQFHPEITYAHILRWTGMNPPSLSMPGAQPREAQIDGHFTHAANVSAWLDTFLTRWIANEIATT